MRSLTIKFIITMFKNGGNIMGITKPCLYSCDSIITGISKEFADFTGFTRDELIGKSLIEIGTLIRINTQILLDNINDKFSGYVFTKSLDPREVNISYFYDKETNKKIYTFVEKPNSRIDDKMIFMEQALSDNIVGISIYSMPDLIMLKVNQKYLDLHDSPYNEEKTSIGLSIREIVTGYVGTESEAITNTVIESRKSSSLRGIKLERFDKNITYLDSNQTPLFEGGIIKYIMFTTSESTEEVLKNKNIERQNKIIKQQKEQLEQQKKELEKALKLQEEFIVNISHELKTPLNVISSAAQLFSMYCSCGSLDEKKSSIVKYIDSIRQNSYRLSKLINNIVDSSKIEAGFFKINLSNNNIVEVVEDIVMSVTNLTESKGLNIIFDTDIEEKFIACDVEKIERIVLNLISNAIKFSNCGDEIFVEVEDKYEFIEISVKDNGVGIKKKYLDMIFDRFKQVDKSLSRNAEGTGIGLSLVKSIVELHGGSISVESKFGQGSKFTVMIPAEKVLKESRIYNNEVKSRDQNIRVELSNAYS